MFDDPQSLSCGNWPQDAFKRGVTIFLGNPEKPTFSPKVDPIT
jgi:hypothetical protein